jgi:hypothetical protein
MFKIFVPSTFRSMYSVPNIAVFCSSINFRFHDMLLRHFLKLFWDGSSCPYHNWYNLVFFMPRALYCYCTSLQFIKKNPTRSNNVSTCFERHTAHHQKPKTALAASGHVVGGRCQAHWAWQRPPTTSPPTTRPTTFHIWKTRGCQCSFRFLMMGGVSPETCWASYKYGIIKS